MSSKCFNDSAKFEKSSFEERTTNLGNDDWFLLDLDLTDGQLIILLPEQVLLLLLLVLLLSFLFVANMLSKLKHYMVILF